jgi:NAD(P)-dependent dehydrogenase (short-subunit alcohol dehydrogenase family)
MRFTKKTILDVGGTSGLGKATAAAFAHEGGRVFLTGRRAQLGNQVASEINAAGGSARFLEADIRRAADCERTVDHVLQAAGRLDIAFNNSGVASPSGLLGDLDEAA